MSEPRSTPGRYSFAPSQRAEMIALALLSLSISLLTTLIALGPGGLARLGAYFDGHFYIEIARSFPLPYSADGRDYLGQAPGFAALLSLLRLLTPDALNWGVLALGATWLSAVAAVLAFTLLCRELDVPAFPAGLTFLCLNPVWALVTSAAHPEPLAVTFALLCFTAHLRGSLPWSVVWLSLLLLTRFPAILLGGALAFDLLVVRRQLRVRSIAWLSLPLAVFALHNLYLYWRVPGFTGIWDVHQVHWVAEWTYPFSELIRQWSRMGEIALFQRTVIYGTAGFYLIATLLGLRRSERAYWWLSLWAGSILLLHVSLSGQPGVASFTRLAVLAWPAALLIAWRARPRPLPLAALAGTCVAAGAFGIYISFSQIRAAVYVQNLTLWMQPKVRQLESDEPRWIDFKEIRDLDRVRRQRRAERERRLSRPDAGSPTPSPPPGG
jgi:hypothetical protein